MSGHSSHFFSRASSRSTSFQVSFRYELTLKTYFELLTPANGDIIVRTIVMACAVTAAATLIAFPIALYAARHARGRLKALFYLGVMMPLWSSYLVKIYAWKLILAKEGIINWVVEGLGLAFVLNAILAFPVIGGNSLSVSYIGTFIVLLYVWLPFMILPLQAALERVPEPLLEASDDLGATSGQTLRHVIIPLALPGMIAGSIFTFSLTMGDYIVPQIIGSSRRFIGQAVYAHQGNRREHSACRRLCRGADHRHGVLSLVRQAQGSLRCTLNARRPSC